MDVLWVGERDVGGGQPLIIITPTLTEQDVSVFPRVNGIKESSTIIFPTFSRSTPPSTTYPFNNHVFSMCLARGLVDEVSGVDRTDIGNCIADIATQSARGYTPEAAALRTTSHPITLFYGGHYQLENPLLSLNQDVLPGNACWAEGCQWEGVPGSATVPDPFGEYLVICDNCLKRRSHHLVKLEKEAILKREQGFVVSWRATS
jgi:hypothetical protein